MKTSPIFDESKVVAYSREAEFKQIPHAALIDYVPGIEKKDLAILESWRQDFDKKKKPYAVTQRMAVQRGREVVLLSLWARNKA